LDKKEVVRTGSTGLLITDLFQLMQATQPPLWKRVGAMVVQGIVYAVIILSVATALSRATGQSSLAERVDRNAQVTVEGSKALRCVASRPQQPRTFKEQQAFVDQCYAKFDQLVKEVQNEG
jgi:hypothetical protein